MEELNICTLFILSNQPTTQPAYQPKSEKCAYLRRFSTNLVKIWYGVFKWKGSTHVCELCTVRCMKKDTSQSSCFRDSKSTFWGSS